MAGVEVNPTLENTIEVLKCLYFGSDVHAKENASKWLEALQKSLHAWEMADKILRMDQPMEFCYFAAQTMKTKIRHSFHELPVEVHESLKDSLLEHVSRIDDNTPAVIITQLSLALADLAVQMPSWNNPIQALAQRFAQEQKYMAFMLEVLQVLPEEMGSRSLRVGQNRRADLREDLRRSAEFLLQFLTHCMEHSASMRAPSGGGSAAVSSSMLQSRVYRCAGAWLQQGAIPQELLISSPLLTSVFNSLTDKACPSHVHEAATVCVCNAVAMCADIENFGILTMQLWQAICQLKEAYHVAAAEEEIDKCMNYVRIFTELGETLLLKMIETPNQGLGSFGTMEMLLLCAESQHYEVVDVTFNFWNGLSEVLYDKNSDELNAHFAGLVLRLLLQLTQHIQLDSELQGLLSRSDDFYDFRDRVKELFRDVAFIVGSSKIFRELWKLLQDPAASSQWNVVEAVFFNMASIARNLMPDMADTVTDVIEATLQLQSDSTPLALRLTSVKMIGELCEWIDQHPQHLGTSLEVCMSLLQHGEAQVTSQSAASVQKLCEACSRHLVSHADTLFSLLTSIDSLKLSRRATLDLFKGIAQVIGQLQGEELNKKLTLLCSDHASKIGDTLQNNSVSTNRDVSTYLDRLAAMFKHVDAAEGPIDRSEKYSAIFPVVQQTWPVISSLIDAHINTSSMSERCCRCMRYMLRSLRKASAPLLPQISQQLTGWYGRQQHCCFLYVSSILVDELGSIDSCSDDLLHMFQMFCTPTFKLLESAESMKHHPDTVDDFFRLCSRFIQRLPGHYLKSSFAEPVVRCAIACTVLDHRDASSSVIKMLEEIVAIATSSKRWEHSDPAQILVQKIAPDMVSALLKACTLHVGMYSVPEVTLVLHLLNRDPYTHFFSGWLEHGLTQLPCYSASSPLGATADQMKQVHLALCTAKEQHDKRMALKTFVRLYR